ncbi:RsmB/NOP family class I SAM-dependent RNA methyltransferase [Alphaproteobacteria bacterium]|nr:RsmB/NOP family class I SAM-dependent RNA methyltransferase [Alphaproteobacteria bacterium]
MKKKDKARDLIMKGISYHLKGMPQKKINDYYNKYFKKYNFSEDDISFVIYFTNISIRHRGQIEEIIKKYVRKKLPKNIIEIKAGLILGAAQIFFSKIPAYALVDSTVNLFQGRIKKWKSLANAVLRKINKEKKSLEGIINNINLSIPNWLYASWQTQYGKKEVIKLLKVFQDEPPLDLRIMKNIDYWSKLLDGDKLGNNTIRLFVKGKVENIKGYKEGKWWVQDIAAQIPVKLMGNIKNKKVLDLCAAPGGKTAQMLCQGAFVKSVEISRERSEILSKNIDRLDLSKNLEIELIDLMSFKAKPIYDIVLLDAPCSGTGTFRKNPDVVWIKNKRDVVKNANIQKRLLVKSLSFVKTKGFLIYSNCSLQKEEGEFLINSLLKEKIIKIDEIKEKEIIGYPKEIINKGLIRTLPYMYNNGMDGFFIARIKKNY